MLSKITAPHQQKRKYIEEDPRRVEGERVDMIKIHCIHKVLKEKNLKSNLKQSSPKDWWYTPVIPA